jgi:vancomycin resistance protein VanW
VKRLVGLVALVGSVSALGFASLQPKDKEIARYSTTLEGRTGSQRHNAMLALEKLNGAVIKPGEVFSFNQRVGSFSRDQGYRKAPVSYNGQLIDSWGGGVCQASTTLYNAALLAGFGIVERNRHRFAPTYVPPGRDAAVAFDTIDLKFRNPYAHPVQIKAALSGDRVEVSFVGREGPAQRPEIVAEFKQVQDPQLFTMGNGVKYGRVRNPGKDGFDVKVFRIVDGNREFISEDSYPAMARVLQVR